MNNRLKLLIAACLIFGALFWGDLKNVIPQIPDIDPKPSIIIEKPEDSMIAEWESVADTITDSDDRIKLCVFNKTFADRVINYEAKAQQVNDVYVNAAKKFFGDSLKGKYDKLSPAIQEAMKSVLGEEDHNIIEPERIDLNKKFLAFAWSLNN